MNNVAKMNKKEKIYAWRYFVNKYQNKNETRVIGLLPKVLTEFPEFEPDIIDIQDIYALTLNKLQPRYVQRASVVLREPVTNEIIKEQLREAIKRVRKYPNHNIAFNQCAFFEINKFFCYRVKCPIIRPIKTKTPAFYTFN